MNVTRRRLLIAGRTGLLGLAGVGFAVAVHTSADTPTSDAKSQRRKQRSGKKHKQQNKKGHSHQGKQRNRGKKKSNNKDVRLSSGSVIPERLISEENGRLSAHMLLPFEEFATEAALAQAVAEAEELGLFILPDAPAADEVTPAA